MVSSKKSLIKDVFSEPSERNGWDTLRNTRQESLRSIYQSVWKSTSKERKERAVGRDGGVGVVCRRINLIHTEPEAWGATSSKRPIGSRRQLQGRSERLSVTQWRCRRRGKTNKADRLNIKDESVYARPTSILAPAATDVKWIQHFPSLLSH